MTYMLKTLIVAFIASTALGAQVSLAYAMGSDREPHTTNMETRASTQESTTLQKNIVLSFTPSKEPMSFIGNEDFLIQR